jgi:hypothetical protein
MRSTGAYTFNDNILGKKSLMNRECMGMACLYVFTSASCSIHYPRECTHSSVHSQLHAILLHELGVVPLKRCAISAVYILSLYR